VAVFASRAPNGPSYGAWTDLGAIHEHAGRRLCGPGAQFGATTTRKKVGGRSCSSVPEKPAFRNIRSYSENG